MTDTTTETSTNEFTITRVLEAPAELVYQAWILPEHLAGWLGPRDFTTPLETIAVDARVGGRWRATMVAPDGSEYPTGGYYRELSPYRRIVFSWGNADGDRIVDDVMTCSVTLTESDGLTQMTFHQVGPAELEQANEMLEGWAEASSRLIRYIASKRPR